MNREFVMLAHVFDPLKDSVGGWMMSEKLDGVRCFWDGGITRGIPCRDIPFANVEKHGRFLNEKVSSGLWTRYGQPIAAPDYFIKHLPKVFLDGELYAGRGNFQDVTSTIKDHVPGPGWQRIFFMVFDSPDPLVVFQDGRINNTNFRKEFLGFQHWFVEKQFEMTNYGGQFEFTYKALCSLLKDNPVVKCHSQLMLPFAQDKAIQVIEDQLDDIVKNKGEGLILRKRESRWEPFRTRNLLKVKPYLDSEATVFGYITGRKTDKGSKLLGKMGALIVEWQGIRFELSGFTDDERTLRYCNFIVTPYAAKHWACEHPEEQCPSHIECPQFPRGSKVTFKYRELTKDGVPKEARYHRRSQ